MNESERRERRDPPPHDDIGPSGPSSQYPCASVRTVPRDLPRPVVDDAADRAIDTLADSERLKRLWGTYREPPVF